MIYSRQNLLRRIEKGFLESPIVLLLGPRQCGKTTLARHFEGRPDVHWFDLENYLHASRLADNPAGTLDPLRGFVIFDEIQRAPHLFPYLRVLADRPTLPARFLLLGSGSPSLASTSGETLAGRTFHIEMAGFSASEVGNDYQSRLWLRGGFPRSFLSSSDADSLKWRRDFISDFLGRDLPSLAAMRISAQQLRRLLLLLASENGMPINASNLGRNLGIDFKTAQRYLDVLEAAFITRTLPPYHANVAKRVRKTPKLFFRDTGILHALLGLETLEQAETSGRMGFSWESFCLDHLIREGGLPAEDCFHYSVQSGAELDLVLQRGGQTLGFEFKHSDVPQVTPSTRSAADDVNANRVFIVYPGPTSFPMDPANRFWALAWRDISGLQNFLG